MIPKILFEVCNFAPEVPYDLTRPFIEHGWLVATDRRILVYSPLSALPAGASDRFARGNRHLPKDSVVDLVSGKAARLGSGERLSLPRGLVPFEVCPSCRAGQGWEWPLVPAGKPICGECDGDGWVWAPSVKVGSLWLTPYYVDLLLRHGVESVTRSASPIEPVSFVGDGFQGHLMPCDPVQIAAFLKARAAP